MSTTIKRSFILIFAMLILCAMLCVGFPINTVQALEFYEEEGNDTVQIANLSNVSPSSSPVKISIKGNLANGNDVDWYRYEIKSNGYITVDFSHDPISSGSTYWRFSIYHADGVTTIDDCNGSWSVPGNRDISTYKLGVVGGIYYVKIYADSYSSVNYYLTVNYTEDANWETEVNNTYSKADKIEVDNTYYGSTSSSLDSDWYQFSIAQNGYISIDFKHDTVSSSSDSWKLALYQNNGSTYYDNNNSLWSVKGNDNLTTPKLGVQAGTYYINVSVANYSAVTYNFTVNYTKSNTWETEENNTYNKADKIEVNNTYYGAISSNGEEDWYEFTILENACLNIDFKHENISSSSIYWKFSLFQSDGITYYDDCSSAWSVLGNENFSTGQLGVQAGTYYIKVYADTYSSIPYSLIVNYTPSNEWESEANNTSSKANNIYDGKIIGATNNAGDVDWYKFSISATDKIAITFKHSALDSSDTYWKVYVYDSDAVTQINFFTVAGNVLSTSGDYFEITPGDYYIKIETASHSNKTYTLTFDKFHEHVGDWVKTTPTACTEGGTESRTCTICGLVETRDVLPTGHNYSDEYIVKTTIFKVGTIKHTCLVCGDSYTVEDKSKVWILPVIIVGVIVGIFGLINYIKMMKK